MNLPLVLPSSLQSELPTARPARRRVALLGLAAVVALVTAVAGATWWWTAGSRLDAVSLIAAPGGVTCERGTVRLPEPEPFGASLSDLDLVPVVGTQPDMRCSVLLLVRNRSGSEVHLERLVVPAMGPGAAGAAQVLSVSPVGDVDSDLGDESGGTDAVLALDGVLGPHELRQLVLHLSFRPDGCLPPGSRMAPGGPFLHVRALGRTGVLQPALPAFAIAGSSATIC